MSFRIPSAPGGLPSLFLLASFAVGLFLGCARDGDDGRRGKNGKDTGVVAGTVTNGVTGGALAGATIAFQP